MKKKGAKIYKKAYIRWLLMLVRKVTNVGKTIMDNLQEDHETSRQK